MKIVNETKMTHSGYSKRFVENTPDSDHFYENSAITQRIAKRCQPGIHLIVYNHNTTYNNSEYMSYITKNRDKVLVSGGNDKCDDIEVENYSSQSNDIVEFWARQTNQSVV